MGCKDIDLISVEQLWTIINVQESINDVNVRICAIYFFSKLYWQGFNFAPHSFHLLH